MRPMPDEIEVPTEHLHEHMKEEAEHATSRWIGQVALSSAILAVLAALTALMAGHHANEGVLEEIQASDRWAFYQAKGIKASVLETKTELLRELGHEPRAADMQQIDDYKKDQKDIQDEAKQLEESSDHHMARHNIFARTVTLFQIAIALAAISVLARRRWVWFVSLALSVAGLVTMAQAFI
jgi:hypothetical protein